MLESEFIPWFLTVVVENLEKFQRNCNVHSLHTKYTYKLHMPHSNLKKYKKGEQYTGIRLCSIPPPTTKSLNNDIKLLKQH